MSWASLILGLVKLADLLATYAANRQLLKAGAAEQLQKDLADVVAKSHLFATINAQVAGSSDADVDRRLREKFGRELPDSGGNGPDINADKPS